MKKISTFFEKHNIILFLVLGILYLAFSKLPALVSNIFSLDRNNVVVENVLQGVYLFLFSVLLFAIIRKYEVEKSSGGKSLSFCILLGFPFAIVSIGYLLRLTLLPNTFFEINVFGILSVFFHYIMVGIEEELQFRGLFFPLMLRKYENQKHSHMKAALFSSVLFGVMHIFVPLCISLIMGEKIQSNEMETFIYQVFYATCGGVVFAAITLYHKSILPAVIWHAILDICAFLYQGLMSKFVYETYIKPYDGFDVLHLGEIFTWKIGSIKLLAIFLYVLVLCYGVFLIYRYEKMERLHEKM